MKQLNVRPVCIPLMKNILEIIFQSQRNGLLISIEKVSIVLEKNIKSIKNGLYMLRQFEIIQVSPNPLLYDYIFNQIKDDHSIDKIIFNKIIIFPLFVEYLNLLKKNKDDIEAALILKHLFNIKSSDKIIKTTFDSWIKYYKINVQGEEKPIIINKELKDKSSAISNIRNDFNDNLDKIPEIVILDLAEGIVNAQIKPDSSLTDTGRALENYLRLKFRNNTDLNKCNGIGQITQKLQQKKLINSKHNKILDALGSIRSIGDAHGLDKEEMKKWEISSDTALIYSAMTIKIMKSLEDYKNGLLSF